MNKSIIKASLSNAVYFSLASFLIIFLASLLYQGLEKTTGKLDLGIVLIIVLSLTLIIFVLSITHIVLTEHEKESIKFWERIIGVGLFLITSAIILGVLGFLFWFEI